MKRRAATLGLGLTLCVTLPLGATESGSRRSPCSPAAKLPTPSTYYGIDLVPTKRVPGTGLATGTGRLTFARSPFGVSVSPEGSYVYDLSLNVERLKPAKKGAYTAWISTPSLDRVKRLGVFDERFELSGRVDWNKFLVIVTLEPSAKEAGDMWRGPIVLRGLSRSGLMHTLAGHGPYEEPCAVYGY